MVSTPPHSFQYRRERAPFKPTLPGNGYCVFTSTM